MGDSRSSETEIRCCCLFKDSGRKNDHREEGAVIHGDNKIDFCNKYNGDFGDCPVSTGVTCGLLDVTDAVPWMEERGRWRPLGPGLDTSP